MNIPARIFRPEDNAGALLTAGISSVDVILNVDDASLFPNSVFGTAEVSTTTPESQLNLVGIGTLSPNGRLIQVGDQIVNWTDGSYAYVEAVSANFITTTCLKGGGVNVWTLADEFSTLPFMINVNKKVLNGTTNLLEVTQQELMMCRYRNGNIIRVEQRAFAEAGKVGSQSFAFASNDYVDLFVSSGHWHEMTKALAMLESNKMELNEKRDATFSGNMDFQGSATLVNLPANPGDPTAVVVNSQLNAITATQAFALTVQHPLPFMDPVLNWNNIVNSDPGFEYIVYNRVTSGSAEPRTGTAAQTVLPSTTTQYIDTNPSSAGPLNYNSYAVAYQPVGSTTQRVFTNTVEITFDPSGAIQSGYYGDSSDGAYVPGTPLERSRVYNFTSFVTALTVTVQGNGTLPIVFVDGNIDLQAGCLFNYTNSLVQDFTQNVTIERIGPPDVVASVSCGVQLGGVGGVGGEGGNSDLFSGVPMSTNPGGLAGTVGQDGGAGSNLFVFGTSADGGIGGLAGINGNTSTGGGGGGGGGGRNGTCGPGTIGAGGANGGGLTSFNTSVIFISSGTVNIAAAVQFNMPGIAGTPGQAGGISSSAVCAANCFGPAFQYAGLGGSSGGGGGSGGVDGSRVVFCHSGVFTNLGAVEVFTGGALGAGGAAGPAQIHPCQTAGGIADGVGQAGAPGAPGVAGVNGGLFNFTID